MSYRKYGNHVVRYDGYKFDSDQEFERYVYLKNQQIRGKISNLTVHPEYPLLSTFSVGGKKFREIKYIADFEYIKDGFTVIEDVKGVETDVFKLKYKMFAAKYGKIISIVKQTRNGWVIE